MEQFANLANTTLASPMLIGDTSLVVSNAASFPTVGNFRIIVEAEIILVTAVSGTTFTVSRAQEGTTAFGHSTGATVAHILTAGAIAQVRGDWQTLLDLDLTAAATQTIFNTVSGSGTFSLGGYTWTWNTNGGGGGNYTITHGTGLVMTPNTSTTYDGTRTLPTIHLPFTQLISGLDSASSFRVLLYQSTESPGTGSWADFDAGVIAIDSDDANWGFVAKRGHFSTLNMKSFFNANATDVSGLQTDTPTFDNPSRVFGLEVLDLAHPSFKVLWGTYSAPWPAISSLTRGTVYTQSGRVDGSTFVSNNMGLTIGSQRVSSATSLVITIARLRIDAKP